MILTGTEAGEEAFADAIRSAADARGWYAFVHGSGEWVAFDLGWGAHLDHGFVACIPGTSKHKQRGIAWVRIRSDDELVGDVAVGSVHLLTADSPDVEWNDDLKAAVRRWANDQTAAGRLPFVNADTNTNDETKDVWGNGVMITSWDELGKYPGTIEKTGRTIDVISRHGATDRATFTAGRAYNDEDLDLYSDHRLIEATVRVGP